MACKEQIYLREILELIREFTKPKVKIEAFTTGYVCHNFLPSVECGPVSIHKIRKELDFNPCSIVSVINEIHIF